MKPMLESARHLAGGTSEKLAKAPFCCVPPPRPGTQEKPVVGDEFAVEEVPPDARATVSLVSTSVPESMMLYLPANLEM